MANGTVIADEQIKALLQQNMPEGVVLVDANIGPNRERRNGLDEALAQRGQGKNIIVMSFESPASLYQDKRFQEHMASHLGHYVRLPQLVQELYAVLNLPRFDNPALEAFAASQFKQDQVGILLHNYKHRPNEVLQRAREIDFEGSDDEVYRALQRYHAMGETAKGYFRGVFVDVEGTILKNRQLDEGLVKRLKLDVELGPVSFWTGGDIKELAPLIYSSLEKLAEISPTAEVLFHRSPILPKDFFRGVSVEAVYDDQPEELAGNYGITASKIHHVN